MRKLALILLFSLSAAAAPAFAKDQFETAKVISQNVGPYNGGGVTGFSGNVAIGGAILRAINTVVLETPQRRITLIEITGKNYMLLTVNHSVSYRLDGNRGYIEDENHKTHKFYVSRLEDITQEK